MSKWSVALVVGSVIVVGYRLLEHKADEVRATQPVVDTTVAQMIESCAKNEVAFESYWDGKSARVIGKVAEVDAGISSGVLRFRGKSRWDTVNAYDLPDSFLATLKKGQTINVTCERVYESMGDPRLSKCRP